MMFGLTGVLAQQVGDLVNPRYCPQNTTGFYTINATINPQQDLVSYCPQNTTGFYNFAQAP